MSFESRRLITEKCEKDGHSFDDNRVCQRCMFIECLQCDVEWIGDDGTCRKCGRVYLPLHEHRKIEKLFMRQNNIAIARNKRR